MKANELRIGNLVSFKDENDLWNPKEATTRDIFNLLSAHESVKSCYAPISLTEEWLRKFRFEHDFHQLGDEYRKGKFSMYYYNGNYPGEKGELLAASIMGNDVEIQYVHQLQNLYFALTGEELTTK